MKNFRLDIDADGVALIAFDIPGRSVNTLTDEVVAELPLLVERIRSDAAIRGAVLYSGKSTGFCAGADLGDLGRRVGTHIAPHQQPDAFRQLEKCGKPIACALEGVALGGGLEFALACHYRVATTSSAVKLGLPEVTVGLMPGAGGTQRLPRLMGVAKALPLLMDGKPVSGREALDLGFVDELAEPGKSLEVAQRWVASAGPTVARWDRKDFRIPGGSPYSPSGMQTFTMANAMLRKKTFGNFPGAENILKAVYEGMLVPIDAALKIEANYFANTFATPQARAMVRSVFLSRQALAKGDEFVGLHAAPKRVAVVGAGLMGAGIAYVQASRGIETLLIDIDESTADRGKDYARKLVQGRVAKGRMTQQAADDLLARIKPSADYAEMASVDLVIEAVFEDLALKREVLKRIEAAAPGVMIGTNTSTLPISTLAETSSLPEDLVGIHFFSPVDRMELVEIIRGRKTSVDAVGRAVAYAVALGKTPIIVNDSRGFYTSRCFSTYLHEGMEMLVEGVLPALIENAGRMTGMPRGPLEISDDVALDLALRVEEEARTALGEGYAQNAAGVVLKEMVSRGRLGRKSQAGFYDYPTDGRKMLWPGLKDMAADAVSTAGVEECKRRLLYRQALEAARCFAEDVITDPRAADIGALLGFGFPAWTGGPLSYIDMIGARRFVDECDALAERFGSRFTPPHELRQMASEGGSYYPVALTSAEHLNVA
ncbi:MAG: 3-hydroxyacyl-CoA dehydrogenase NAD-binding domain-containing protein [Novosphingobium sp.]